MKTQEQIIKELRIRIGRRPSSYNDKRSNEGFCKGLVWVLMGSVRMTIPQIMNFFHIIQNEPKFERAK